MRLCIVCKAPIDAERIEAIPEARLCTEHSRKIQKYGGEFVVSVSQERTSKPGSLKINYGGVSTGKVRNDAAIDRMRVEYEADQFRDPN